jgi:hypothetical protein
MGDTFADFRRAMAAPSTGEKYERDAALRVLAGLGLGSHAGDLEREVRGRVGPGGRLTLDLVRESFPGLGVRFVARRVPDLHKVTVERLFSAPEKTPPVRAWLDAAAELAPGGEEPVVLVTPWTGVLRGGRFVAFHDARSSPSRRGDAPEGGTRLVLDVPVPRGRVAVYVERLDDLLAWLGPVAGG